MLAAFGIFLSCFWFLVCWCWLFLDREQLGGLSPEADEFAIFRLIFVHPLRGLVIQPVRLVFVTKLQMGHGQEEPIETVSPFANIHGFLKPGDSVRPITVTVVSNAQRVGERRLSWGFGHCPTSQLNGSLRIPETQVGRSDQEPSKVIGSLRIPGIPLAKLGREVLGSVCVKIND